MCHQSRRSEDIVCKVLLYSRLADGPTMLQPPRTRSRPDLQPTAMAPKKKQVTESPVKNATSILPVEKAHELAKERANTYFERSQLGSATHATRKSDDATSAPAHWKAALTYELPETASSSVYDLIAKAPPLAAEAPKKRTKAVRGPSSHDPAEQPEDARGGAGVSERSSDLGYFEVDSDEEAEDPKADSNPVILNLLKSQFPQVLLYEVGRNEAER